MPGFSSFLLDILILSINLIFHLRLLKANFPLEVYQGISLTESASHHEDGRRPRKLLSEAELYESLKAYFPPEMYQGISLTESASHHTDRML